MYPKAEILFPPKLISSLRDLRGPEWADLITRIARLPETSPEVLAFCLMMIDMNGCMNCYAGSYKFMRGCAACARQTITQYKGSDDELLTLYQRASEQLDTYIQQQAVQENSKAGARRTG
ncbi:MAG: hypothetical protein ABTQ73_10255 [Caldilineales bacterium]